MYLKNTKAGKLRLETLKVKALHIWIAFTKDAKEKKKIQETLPRKPLVEVNPIIDKDLTTAFLNGNSETVSPRN